MNIIKKIKDNRYKKKLLKRIDKAKLGYFCLKTGVELDYFSNYFLELLLKHPNLIDDLINTTSSIELDKLNNKTYTLNDITYDNLWLLKYLEFSDEEKKIIDIINNSINKENVFLDSKYYFVKCNSLEEISNLNIENQNLVESYFEDINLVTDTNKYFEFNEFDFDKVYLMILDYFKNNNKTIVIDSAQFRNIKDISILKGSVIVVRTSINTCYKRCIKRYKERNMFTSNESINDYSLRKKNIYKWYHSLNDFLRKIDKY